MKLVKLPHPLVFSKASQLYRQRKKRIANAIFKVLPVLGIATLIVIFVSLPIMSYKSDDKKCSTSYGSNWDHQTLNATDNIEGNSKTVCVNKDNPSETKPVPN